MEKINKGKTKYYFNRFLYVLLYKEDIIELLELLKSSAKITKLTIGSYSFNDNEDFKSLNYKANNVKDLHITANIKEDELIIDFNYFYDELYNRNSIHISNYDNNELTGLYYKVLLFVNKRQHINFFPFRFWMSLIVIFTTLFLIASLIQNPYLITYNYYLSPIFNVLFFSSILYLILHFFYKKNAIEIYLRDERKEHFFYKRY